MQSDAEMPHAGDARIGPGEAGNAGDDASGARLRMMEAGRLEGGR